MRARRLPSDKSEQPYPQIAPISAESRYTEIKNVHTVSWVLQSSFIMSNGSPFYLLRSSE